MMFFGKTKTPNSTQPKRRSMLGILFNPEIGASLRPLGESASASVKLVATIFAMNGLFPKNHPALLGEPGSPRLSLFGVLQTAWRGLIFTKEGLPKVILFFAVTGAMLFSVLAALTIFLLMFVGHAHAQGANGSNGVFFTPPDTTNDLAQGWIDFLFKNKPLPSYVDNGGQAITQYTGIQQALIITLGFYSNAILILAAIILFYHLVSMVVETAHHGVAMGKRASQIWAPIRLVVAIGLLVPVGSSGLNSGQFIVIQMAEWGSGLASQIWSHFTQAFINVAYVAPPGASPHIHNFAESIVAMEACNQIYNYHLTNASSAGGDTLSNDALQLSAIQGLPSGDTGNVWETTLDANQHMDVNVCGKWVLHKLGTSQSTTFGQIETSGLATTVAPAIEQAQAAAFAAAQQQAHSDISPFFNGNSSNFVDNNRNGFPTSTTDIINDVANQYEQTLSSGITSAMNNLVDSAQSQSTSWTSLGWVAAGAYFNNIASTQGAIEAAVQDDFPSVDPPGIVTVEKKYEANTGQPSPLYSSVISDLSSFEHWALHNEGQGSAPPAPPASLGAGSCDQAYLQGIETEFDDFVKSINLKSENSGKMIDVLTQFADYTAAINCVWRPQTAAQTTSQLAAGKSILGIELTSGNPFAELARLGHANLNTAYTLMDQILGIEAAGGAMGFMGHIGRGGQSFMGSLPGLAAQGVSGIAQIWAGIISFLALIFFAAGFMLAFFVPLIPFIKFFFNVLSWIGTVLEAVVMMPLVALAHINPEGDGLPGASAKQGYFFLLNIFLRPALMVFGLLCGLLIFLAAVAFMNKMYSFAVLSSVGFGPHILMSRLIDSMIYVVLIYIAANNSFKLIHAFPDNALLWIGGPQHRRESFGEADELGSRMGAVSAIAGQQVFEKIQGAGRSIQTGAGNAGQAVSNARTNAASSQVAAERHGAAMRAQGAHPDGTPRLPPPQQPPPPEEEGH